MSFNSTGNQAVTDGQSRNALTILLSRAVARCQISIAQSMRLGQRVYLAPAHFDMD
jgi:hypothetical protein